MDSKAILGLSILLGLIAFGRVAQLYVWPSLQGMRREDALNALVMPHLFRFIGLSFLMPGVVMPEMPAAFAVSTAYGDLVATFLALVATTALSTRASWALAAVWLLNIQGTADLLLAYYKGVIGVQLDPGVMGAAFYIPTVIVPLLLTAHAMSFLLLSRGRHPAAEALNEGTE